MNSVLNSGSTKEIKQDKCCGSYLGLYLTYRLLYNNLFVNHNLGEELKYDFKLFI